MNIRSVSKLSKNEHEMLEVMWNAAVPLSVTEICDHAMSLDMELNQSTVQVNVSKLLKKGIIRVGGITQKHKALARTFEPTLTQSDLVLIQLRQMVDALGEEDRDRLLTALIDDHKKNKYVSPSR